MNKQCINIRFKYVGQGIEPLIDLANQLEAAIADERVGEYDSAA